MAERDLTAMAGGEEDEDDTPMLSSLTMEALREFLSEQKLSIQQENEEEEEERVKLVSENWNLSQFWYQKETAETISEEIVSISKKGSSSSSIACLACPTLYAYLKVFISFLICFIKILFYSMIPDFQILFLICL